MASNATDNYVYELKQLIRESFTLINAIPQETPVDATQIPALRACADALIALGMILLPHDEKMRVLDERAEILLALKPGEALIPKGIPELTVFDEAAPFTQEQWDIMLAHVRKREKRYRC